MCCCCHWMFAFHMWFGFTLLLLCLISQWLRTSCIFFERFGGMLPLFLFLFNINRAYIQSQSTYFTVRGQSYFSRFPKYWPPPSPSPPGEGDGGSIFWKTREIGLPSYSKVCTLCIQYFIYNTHRAPLLYSISRSVKGISARCSCFLVSFYILVFSFFLSPDDRAIMAPSLGLFLAILYICLCLSQSQLWVVSVANQTTVRKHDTLSVIGVLPHTMYLVFSNTPPPPSVLDRETAYLC